MGEIRNYCDFSHKNGSQAVFLLTKHKKHAKIKTVLKNEMKIKILSISIGLILLAGAGFLIKQTIQTSGNGTSIEQESCEGELCNAQEEETAGEEMSWQQEASEQQEASGQDEASEQDGTAEQEKDIITEKLEMPKTEDSHFAFMHPQAAYEEAEKLNVFWERPHLGPFIWNELQKEKNGEFDWSFSDQYVKESQSFNFNIIGTIWPFADWDQRPCRCCSALSYCRGYGFEKPGELPTYRCAPCDMEAYSAFVQALIERYDGDGKNDMPDLKYPIKYWEASNEPEMQEKELTFFKGTSNEYLQILEATYNAVKSADPQAQVLHAGFAGMSNFSLDFWKPIFSNNGGDYFDIANVHSIGGDNEDFYVQETKDFLENYNLTNPVWVTEAEYNFLEQGGDFKQGFAELLVKSYASAFGNGAEKIFYVGLTAPSPGHQDAALISESDQKNPIYYSFETLIKKIDYFESAEQIAENQYKFIVNSKAVYILWGTGSVPAEITGFVKITDIDGKEKEMAASSATLNDRPIFLELI